MPRFFIKSDSCIDKTCRITGEEYHHIARVRRVHCGELITCFDEKNNTFELEILQISDEEILANIVQYRPAENPEKKITLCCSVLKGKNFDLVIQKAVEVGVDVIVPVISERTVPLLKGKEEGRLERWEKKIIEATKQCMRKQIPRISLPLSFRDLIDSDESELKIIAHPVSETDFKNLFANSEDVDSISLLIGPEGGFSDQELHMAECSGWQRVSFGFNQLRAETAAIVLSALVMYESGKNRSGGCT